MASKTESDLEYLMDEEMVMNLEPFWDHYLDSLMDMSLE